MSSLASAASLLVAISGLKEVQSVISAIRAADAESGKVAGPMGIQVGGPGGGGGGGCCGCGPAATFEHRDEDRIEPRRVYHPEPRYMPRPVIHPRPRFEVRPTWPVPVPQCPTAPGAGCHATSPLAPPWRLPFPVKPNAAASVKPVKVTVPALDMGHVGVTLDMFL